MPADAPRGRSRRIKDRLATSPAARFPFVVLNILGGRSAHTAAERECLRRHASGKTRLVELGVEQGVGTTVLRQVMAPEGRLYAVDPHRRGRLGVSFPRLIALLSVRRSAGGPVHWLRLPEENAALVVAEREPDGVDFVFSDCVFDYAGLERLWHTWRKQLVRGGTFIQSTSQAFEERTTSDHGTVQFTRDVLLCDPDFELVDVADTFTVLTRTAQ